MKLKTLLATSLACMALTAHAADYDVIIENMPAAFSVEIAGKTFSENTAVSMKRAIVSAESLTRDMVKAPASGGWMPTVTVDDANHQVAIAYAQMFEPATDPTAADAKDYCIYENGNAVYLKFQDPNLVANGFTGDRFVFVEDGTSGKYFIYNKSYGHWITYTQTTDNQVNAKTTAESVVQWTTDKAKAKSWKIVDDGEEGFVDIVPGGLAGVSTKSAGWNFRGGKEYCLNLYDRSDRNSKWMIAGSVSTGSLDCATKVFALPGNPFMHKLVAHAGDHVTSVTNLPAGLELDLTSRSYAFIKGTAPEAGQYTYTVNLNEGTDNEASVDVGFTVSPDLTQPTPFMGLLTWNAFQGNINQEKIMKLADALETFGLKDLGYDHMCIDDQWAEQNRVGGHFSLNKNKFQDLTALCDYVHAKGMKIGIYSDAAALTCSNKQPGSYQYEDVDAQDFVKWGFDLLKYDYCGAPADAKTAEARYSAIYKALAKAQTAAGKKPEDFMLYMCEWGKRSPWLWAANTGATCWRATDDTRDFWTDPTYHGGVLEVMNIMKNIWQYNGPNRFNDADMLVVGLHGTGYSSNDGGGGATPGLTLDEARTNFALWCMWSSPLTLSNNICNLDGKSNNLTGKTVTNKYYQEDLDLIRNRHLIALDQDALGQSAEPVFEDKNSIIFAKDCADGDVAISFTNLGTTKRNISIDLSQVPGLIPGHTYAVLDLFQDAMKVGEVTTADSWTVEQLTKHNTAVFRLRDTNADPIDTPKNTLRPRSVNPTNGTSTTEPIQNVVLTFAQPVTVADGCELDVTVAGTEATVHTAWTEVGNYTLTIPEGTFWNGDYYNPELTYTFSIVEPAPTGWVFPIGFDEDAAATRGDRKLTYIALTEEGKDAQQFEMSSEKVYQNVTNVAIFTCAPEANLTGAIGYQGIWMHGYFYIDLEGDGALSCNATGVSQEGTDCVSYSFWSGDLNYENSGYNSLGQSISGDQRNTVVGNVITLPTFKAPAKAGKYYVRFKVDWNSVEPGGSSVQNIINNGGYIVDAVLQVGDGDVVGINQLLNQQDAHLYDLQGRSVLNAQKGVYINGGRKVIR